jgi:hypothetical protein
VDFSKTTTVDSTASPLNNTTEDFVSKGNISTVSTPFRTKKEGDQSDLVAIIVPAVFGVLVIAAIPVAIILCRRYGAWRVSA